MVMYVEPATAQIRPYVVCAVLRNIQFDKRRYKSFIDLQEKLHQNICRKRSYVAIGTHDLDTLQPPFYYRALPPEEISFIPLTEQHTGRSFTGKELLTHYREDTTCKHLKPYTDLIFDSPVYPIIYDSQQTVLSLPPIINSTHSRIQLHTKNVFIECTGTDLTKANIVLDTVVTMFTEYCTVPFTVEQVQVHYQQPIESASSTNNTTITQYTTPLLSHRECDAKLEEINGYLGLNLNPTTIIQLCDKMQLGPAQYIESNNESIIRVQVPPTRSDILHACDVIEDVAIAYGYNNLPVQVPATICFGAPLPINQFSDLLRIEIANAGFSEMLTHGLCSTAENFTNLRREIAPAVSLSNPANIEYEVIRTSLIPGALKTLAFNESLSHKNGIKLFEISDVVLPIQNEIGAKNERHLVALVSSLTSEFATIHGLVDRILNAVQIPPEEKYGQTSLTIEELQDRKRVARTPNVHYTVRQPIQTDPCFFVGMTAEIVLLYDRPDQAKQEEIIVGTFGVIHPSVLENYEISYPTSLVELNLELLLL
jgi:phenylalanyl-tRNA synthetase beta chain